MKKSLFWGSNRGCQIILLFITLLMILDQSHSYAYAENLTHNLAIGTGYSYLAVKYFTSEKFAIEGRFNYLPGIIVPGGRAYYLFPDLDQLIPGVDLFKNMVGYIGGEMTLVYFSDVGLKGFGFTILPLVGGEYFFNEKISFTLDIGPCLTVLFDGEDTSINTAGFDIVLNIGVNYYFNTNQKKR